MDLKLSTTFIPQERLYFIWVDNVVDVVYIS